MTKQAMTQAIAEYFKTQPVLKAWLFGSFSRGEERPDSDVGFYSYMVQWCLAIPGKSVDDEVRVFVFIPEPTNINIAQ